MWIRELRKHPRFWPVSERREEKELAGTPSQTSGQSGLMGLHWRGKTLKVKAQYLKVKPPSLGCPLARFLTCPIGLTLGSRGAKFYLYLVVDSILCSVSSFPSVVHGSLAKI